MIVCDDARARAFINERIGTSIVSPSFGWCSIDDDGFIRSAVLANSYSGFDIHICGAGALRMGLLREVAWCCFGPLGVSRVTAITREGNKRARRFLEGVGFVEETALLRQYGDEDGRQYRLLREDQRLTRLR